ncbi:MAG: ATP-binding protein [Cardiobacteriaceae bacterium]|nr:ATP-binding protein [Cardiobacteriaceae bacterium]
MSARPLGANRVVFSLLSGILSIGLTLLCLHWLSASAARPETPNSHYLTLLVLAAVSMLTLTGIVFWQIFALLRRLRRQDSSGARLSLSFAFSMIGASLIPIVIISFFSWQFLSYDLGKTFNSRVSTAMEDALELTRTSASLRASQALDQTRYVSDLISRQSYGELVNNIEAMRRQTGAIELAVFDRYGIVVAFAHRDTDVLAVESLAYDTLLRINEQQEFFEFSETDHEYTIDVFADIDKLGSDRYYLHASYAMPDSFNSLADSVRVNYREHRFYEYLQPHITTTILVVLALILTLTILIILWLSVLFGEHMTRPLRKLIYATRKVADGNFAARISGMPKNDLGKLGDHFNAMTAALADAEQNASTAQRALTEQKAYLETIMDNLTAGVITFNHRRELQTFNLSASAILNTPLAARLNQPLPADDEDIRDGYEELMQALSEPLSAHLANWQQEVTLSRFGPRKVLMCHGSHLIEAGKRVRGGQVIVFDDITEFLHNQRNAAWEEVAKRLAHEIKNPLTPIRLQSERLQRKLDGKLEDSADRDLLAKATNTIIDQVETMRTLVSEFGIFARPLAMRTIPADINALIRKASELYVDQRFQYDLAENLPPVAADPVQMQQVFINLVKNAFEARASDLQLLWRTRREGDSLVSISLEDNGPGFADLSKDPFEPYITTKNKGSGLGLAIVKKIITEHGGSISAGHSDTLGGACIRFTLPIHYPDATP